MMEKRTGRRAAIIAAVASLSLLLTSCYVPPDTDNGGQVAGSQNVPFNNVEIRTPTPTPTASPTPTQLATYTPAPTPTGWQSAIQTQANGGTTFVDSNLQTATPTPAGALNTIQVNFGQTTATPKGATATPGNVLKVGSKGESVKKMQQRLKTLGYYSGTVDGDFGENTENAVKAFQKANGLTADGVVGTQTLNKINASNAVTAKPNSGTTATPKPASLANGSLKLGSKGSAVYSLQQRLKYLGYYSGSLDGDFGTSTENAVKAFQRRNGLTVDGKVGEETLAVMNSSNAVRAAGANATATPKPMTTASSLSVGSTGTAVQNVQRRLKELGYYDGTIDGDFGENTEAAVKAFQKRNGLTADGKVGAMTLAMLNNSSAVRAAGTGTVVTTNTPKPNNSVSSLAYGDSGAAVRSLQQRLKELGYYTDTVDGKFGRSTEDAVKAFQKRNGLTADGKVGEQTLTKLNSVSAVKAANAATATPKATQATSLQLGDTGDAVSALQRRLKALGYFTGTVDGIYGSETRTAVRAFQRNNGLNTNGRATAETLAKLNSSSAVVAVTATPKPTATPKATATPYALKQGDSGEEVRKVQQRLKDLGYYRDEVDGVYGASTMHAVKTFQRNNDLTADGKIGAKTLEVLNSKNAVRSATMPTATPKTTATPRPTNTPKPTNTPTPKPTNTPKPTAKATATPRTDIFLGVGMSDKYVPTLQERLIELGYMSGKADGRYEGATEYAVRAFQKRNGLYVDGKAGEETLTKLYSASAKKAANVVSTVGEALSLGMQGNDVKALQTRLRELGYLSASADGSYGENTRVAVYNFQKAHGIKADGKASTATLNAIYNSTAKKASEVDVPLTPTPKPTNGGSVTTVVTTGYTTLAAGDNNEAVRLLQEALKAAGYFSGTVTGNFGSGTQTAVRNFQKAMCLRVTGVAGPTTQRLLYGTSGASITYTALKPGATGTNVYNLQYTLYELGYYSGKISGDYDDATTEAVRAFQERNDIKATGNATSATQQKLYSNKVVSASTVSASYSTLQVGSKGNAVLELKDVLIQLGYLVISGDVSSTYDDVTREAVMLFQNFNGLSSNGIADSATQAVLYSDSAVPYPGH